MKWLGWVHILVKDLHLIGHSRYLYFAAIVSIPYLLTQVIPIYALMQAYHHLDQLNIFNAFVTLVILRLGTGPPQAPANLGGFQALTVLSLLLFHVHRGLAKRFSLVLWGVVTVPLLVCGFIALAITGVKMNELHREAKDSMNGQPQPVSGRRIG